MTSTIITALLILAALALFFVLFNSIHKKQQQKIKKERKDIFLNIIKQHGLRIQQSEEINHYSIGIDRSNGKLLHIDFKITPPAVTLINLHEIRSAKVYNVEGGIYEDKEGKTILTEKYLTKMQLALTLQDQPSIMLPLYDYEDGMLNLATLEQRGQYWQATINSYLQQLAINRSGKHRSLDAIPA